MSRCCISSCKSKKRKQGGNTISFHEFPENLVHRKNWIKKILENDPDIEENFWVNEASRVCSLHFEDICYKKNCKNRTLFPGSIPSIFPSYSENVQNAPRKRTFRGICKQSEKSINFLPKIVTFCSVGLTQLKVALIQFAVSASKEQNVERISKFIKEASENGAKLVCLPECFNAPYGVKYFNEYAEDIPGYTSTALSQSAKENSIYLIGGTFPERHNGKLYNTCLAYGPNGEIVAKHRKVHLFDIDIPGKITFKESAALSAGDSLTMFNLEKWKIGVGVCYDIRFPLMANIYAEKGCQLLVYPGSFNMTTGPAHWELLQKARAVDNQLYVAGVSPARDENSSYVSWGHSSLVSPWGETLCAADEKEKILYAEIDLSYVDEIRAQIPIRNQRRNDLYGFKCVKDFELCTF